MVNCYRLTGAADELVPDAEVRLGGPAALDGPVDSVVANMGFAELLACRDELFALWNGNGPLVLAGIDHWEQVDFLAELGRWPCDSQFVAFAFAETDFPRRAA